MDFTSRIDYNRTNTDIAYEILLCLCDSSFAREEFNLYRERVQESLELTDQQMNNLYDYKTIISLLRPQQKKVFRGLPINCPLKKFREMGVDPNYEHARRVFYEQKNEMDVAITELSKESATLSNIPKQAKTTVVSEKPVLPPLEITKSSTDPTSVSPPTIEIKQREETFPYMEKYSDKSFAIFGETKSYKEELKKLGCKFNSNLKGKAGWVCSIKKEPEVRSFIDSINNKTPKKKDSPSSQSEPSIELEEPSSKSTLEKTPKKEDEVKKNEKQSLILAEFSKNIEDKIAKKIKKMMKLWPSDENNSVHAEKKVRSLPQFQPPQIIEDDKVFILTHEKINDCVTYLECFKPKIKSQYIKMKMQEVIQIKKKNVE